MVKRLEELAKKLISVKGILLILSTVLLLVGVIPNWMWFTFAGGIVGIRMIEKVIYTLKDKE